MKTNLKALASLVLISAVSAGYAQTTASTSAEAQHHHAARRTHRKAEEHRPSVESQIEQLRQQMEQQSTQINVLQQQLTQRDAQLEQAQTAAQQAQAAAQQAEAAATQQQQQLSDNAQAVSSLQNSVADIKTNTQSVVATVRTQQAEVRKMVEQPDELHYKGITLSPAGSFIEAATVNRTRATGSDIPTPFTSIPLTAADNGQMSEFYGTGRQSRLALTAEGNVSNATLRAYYEMDWLGTGPTSNNNQSNSYVLRQRQLWAQVRMNDGWIFTGGQMWSLVTETANLLENKTEVLPPTIDPNYQTGFNWTRQYGFRVVKNFSPNFAIGISAENAQFLTPSCQSTGTAACPKNYLIGSSGTGAGLYNNAGQPGATSSAPAALYSYNLAPDMIAKVAYQNAFVNAELYGLARFFRDRVYPNEPASGSGGTAVGAYNDSTVGGGIGGSVRVHTFEKKIDVALRGLYGDGVGRYGDSTIADTTLRPDAQLALLHAFSAEGELVTHPTPRLDLYALYGGDYVGRAAFAEGTGYEGYGVPGVNNSGCGIEQPAGSTIQTGYTPTAPANCNGSNKDVQEGTLGWWYDFYNGSHGRLRQGFQYSYVERNLWGGAGGSPAATDNVFETSFRYYMP